MMRSVQQEKMMKRIKWKEIHWPTTLFLVITPLIALIFIPIYFYVEAFPGAVLLFALIFAALTNLSITAGYHRLFSHKSYEAHALVRALYLLIGASAWQGSALKWSADHRKHHSKVDSEDDPYSISKGFWYAHMGWLFMKESVDQPPKAPDLEKDWMIRWQHQYYVPIAIIMSFGFPTLVGWIMGAPLAGFLIGGALRVVLTQQSTFLVNSLSHTLGRQTYTEEVSARDSLLVAFLTHGEGYHNFHHKFQFDYRNGIRWYQWDPTKWTIRSLALLGLAKRLRKISEQEILKAKLQMDELRLKSRGFSEAKLEQVRNRILVAQTSLKQARTEYRRLKSEASEVSHRRLEELKMEIELAQLDFQYALKQWKTFLSASVPV
jgi:stearoyl-CoA desaturase (Delta-9 desaturase)